MMLTLDHIQIAHFLATIPPFQKLSEARLQQIAERCQLIRYRMGQTMLVRDRMPTQVMVIYEGQVRVLGYDQRTSSLTSLTVVNAGSFLGWLSLTRGESCESAIASSEVLTITFEADEFLQWMSADASFALAVRSQTTFSEVFELLSVEFQRRADSATDLKQLTQRVWLQTIVLEFQAGALNSQVLASDRVWMISAGSIDGLLVGSSFPLQGRPVREVGELGVRLLGICLEPSLGEPFDWDGSDGIIVEEPAPIDVPSIPILTAPDYPLNPQSDRLAAPQRVYIHGRGSLEAPFACFQMLHKMMGGSFRGDLIRKVIKNQTRRSDRLSLQTAGGIVEMMGLRAQRLTISTASLPRLNPPALIEWKDGLAILYKVTPKDVVLISPETGVASYFLGEFSEIWGSSGSVITVEPMESDRPEKFSLRWFIPAVSKYRWVLIEVLVASFFVQVFGLANPIITQIIIDSVINQNSLATLDVLGILLMGIAIFEAILTSFRTYLFADTTNRIDLKLGTEVIDHLLRLPLSYFERRRVGELAGRINELENIRQFLTGTALTVVLDAVFSVIYIGVMVFYSWTLTLIALATVPVFGLLSMIMSPIVRKQLRKKSERYADTQSYLVEVLTGIQTVKAQNIELKSRWQWRERYTRYIGAGFKNVLTSTTAGSLSGFLTKFSSFLLLWVGAHLVITKELSLGQLIAFRIIAGYVTSPLLRLIQLSQSFQETALSIERLGDILNTPQEVQPSDRDNIPLPEVKGHVVYKDLSFGFNPSDKLQLMNINLDIPAGTFVGIVGQSGSGKSTLTKLLPRLYDPTAGKILVDGYDIHKVELNSLRRQIGIVLQDTLLFEGTIQENISLTRPDATYEDILEASKIAAAHDFIMSLPNGYNTNVGERGSALSGGQRQRIAIARTVLQNPHLLILDEATSALDYQSEQIVCRNLVEAFKDRTVLFITHRLNTIKNADRIVFMDQGVVAEEGTHDELMALRGRYYCLFQQQESQM